VISERTNAVYEFGPFRLKVKEHRLVREGRPIPLTGKAFDTLRALVERHGTLVSKRDLMNAVWPETTVEENNLDRNISTVRKALGEKATGRQYIETVPRVGYRFVAPVEEVAREMPSPGEARLGVGLSEPPPSMHVGFGLRWPVAIGIVLGLIVTAGGYIQWRNGRLRAKPVMVKTMLAA